MLKCIVSQNVDGLHLKSGVPREQLAELHGNNNLETCIDCGRAFLREFRTRTSEDPHEHRTGRSCDDCGGELRDSIISFGEPLPRKTLEQAFTVARASDLCLCLGTSLQVQPAGMVPEYAAMDGGKLVIVK